MKTSLIVLVCLLQASLSFSQFSSVSPNLFIENKGQIKDQYENVRQDIDFVLHSEGMNIFISKGQLTYQFAKQNQLSRVEAQLKGASKSSTIELEEKQAYFENHFSSGRLVGKAFSYKKIVYKNVYPHIDWILKINADNSFEYEFVVGVLGNPSQIQIEYKGINQLSINPHGDLIAQTKLGTIKETAPFTYTKTGKLLKSNYRLHKNTLSFETDPYEGALVIDPKVAWATYYGDVSVASSASATNFYSVATNKKGNVFAAGNSSAINNIATTGAYQTTKKTTTWYKSDLIIVKFDTNGNRLYATYFGNQINAIQARISVDNDIVFLAGSDASNTLATPGAHQVSFASYSNAPFLAKFDDTGALAWATYYGGDDSGFPPFVQCDNIGNVYLAGSTNNTSSIATPGTHRSVYADSIDAFLAKFNSEGKRIWGTYLGGKSNDIIASMVFMSEDGNGSIYTYGSTSSDTGIATPGAYRTSKLGNSDAMLVKFDTSGKRIWGTYFGGDKNEQPFCIVADKKRNIYLTGATYSTTGIATTGAYQTVNKGEYDAFIAKFDSYGKISWSTYFGGSKSENNVGACIDSFGNVYINGHTQSLADIADTSAFQKVFSGGFSDGFFAGFKPDGKKLWSSYYGGELAETMCGFASDGKNIYGVGNTKSVSGIATSGSFLDANSNGGTHAFLVKIGEIYDPLKDTVVLSIKQENLPISNIKLYPNPNSGNFIFETTTGAKDATLSIVDITGKIVWSKEVTSNSNGQIKEDIKLEHISSGVYFMCCNIEGKNEKIEFVKK